MIDPKPNSVIVKFKQDGSVKFGHDNAISSQINRSSIVKNIELACRFFQFLFRTLILLGGILTVKFEYPET